MPHTPAADDEVVCVGDLFALKSYTTRTLHWDTPSGRVSQSIDASDAAATDFNLTGQIIWIVCRAVSGWACSPEGRARLAGATAIELGAGAGLVGLVASQFGSRVVLTDYEPEVLDLLKRNAEVHAAPGCGVEVRCLGWGDGPDTAALLAAYPTRFDVVLAADVVFWAESIPGLADTVAALLAPSGVWLLGYVERVGSHTKALLEHLHRVGLVIQRVLDANSYLDVVSLQRPDALPVMHLLQIGRGPAGSGVAWP